MTPAAAAWCCVGPDGRLDLRTLHGHEVCAWLRVVAAARRETRAEAAADGWSVVRVSVAEAP